MGRGIIFYLNLKKLRRTRSTKLGNSSCRLVAFLILSLVVPIFLISSALLGFFLFKNSVIEEFEPYISNHSTMLAYKNDALIFLDRNGEVIHRTSGRSVANPLPLKEISPHVIAATLAAEDKKFYDHSGLDWPSTARAIHNNLRERDIYYQGGSTITQQLARSLFLNNDKSILRKAKEVILALELEKRYSKDEILELYLNSIYYGAGAYGIEQTAHTYFGKKAKDLNLAESTILAGLTIAPSKLSPTAGSRELAERRQKYVLGQMVKAGFTTQKEAEEAKKTTLVFVPRRAQPLEAPHFVLYLKEELRQQFPNVDLEHSGFKVYTTLEPAMQKRAEGLLAERVAALKYRNVNNGAVLATNPRSGEILAMVGSVNFYQKDWGAVNVLTMPRSPGSTIKPIVYAAAFESGKITTATILHDVPTTYNNGWEIYAPFDWDRKFAGPMLPRRALAHSRNVPAVEVVAKIGVPAVLEAASRLGITGLVDPTNYWLSIAVGGLDVKGIDLATAYGVLANGGVLIRPWGITRVEDRFGRVVYTSKVEKKQVLDPRAAYIVTHILSDPDARGRFLGRLPHPFEIGRPAAAKSGTSQDFKNAWTVGYTPNLLALVWVGNNDASPMNNIWGFESVALVWNRFMKETLAGIPPEAFVPPPGVMFASICPLDGSRAVDGQPATQEPFIDGTAPSSFGACAPLARKRQEEQARIVLAAAEGINRGGQEATNLNHRLIEGQPIGQMRGEAGRGRRRI